jgi:hypothetical protein
MHTLRDSCLLLYFKYSIVLSNLITLLPEYSGYKEEIWFSEMFQWINRTHRVPGYRSRGPEFDSRRYQIFWKAVGQERDPLSLVSTIEELLRRKSSGSGLENRAYSCKDPSSRRGTLTTKAGTNFADSGGRSVGIVRQRTQATEFCLVLNIRKYYVTFCLTLPSKWNVSEYSPFFSSLQLTPHVSAQFCL